MREYKSRLQEVEEQKSIKSALIFGGLTLFIIIIAIFFGIPLFSKFINLFNRNSNTPIATQNANLLPPNLAVLPKYTKEQTIIVKGTATPNSNIKIFFGNSIDETVADSDGNFATNIGLSKGNNVIYAQTVDVNGNTSSNSETYTVNYTNQVPNLTVNSPQNNQNFYGSTQQNITIQGTTDANNTVTVNEHIAVLDAAGRFNYPFTLTNGDNTIKVVSVDLAGNKKEIELKVVFNP